MQKDNMLIRDQERLNVPSGMLVRGRMERMRGKKTIAVKVVTNAPRNEIRETMSDGTIKIAIAASAVDGKANDALCTFLAEQYAVSRRAVRIARGATNIRKIIVITLT